MNIKQTLLVFCFIYGGAQAQNDSLQSYFYLKAHSLVDDILRKDKGRMMLSKTFDFSNEKDLATSPLYDKMLDSHKRCFTPSKRFEITSEEYDNLKDKYGWVKGAICNTYKYWDKNSLLKSTPILVDSLITVRRRDSRDPIAFRSIQISFKGNLALIEYLEFQGVELAAYILYKENW